MSQGDEFLVTSKPKLQQWQLPQQSTDCVTMIGWHAAAGSGVPANVAQILLRAFTTTGWVSFFDASEPAELSDTRVARLEAGIGGRLRASLARFPHEIFLISTRRWDVGVSAFDASIFSWSMLGQALLISDGEAPTAAVGWDEAMVITGREEPITAQMLSAWNLDAIVFPGVDGDVAGLISASAPIEERILEDLRAEAEAADFTWRTLAENEFAEAL
jgi:hypothetical protein